MICYGCGQKGHIKPDCPSKPPGGWPTKGGGQASGGNGQTNRGGNNVKNNNGKRNRPTGKLNCATLEEVDNSEHAVIGTLNILTNPAKFYLILVQLLHSFLKNFVISSGLEGQR